MPIDYGALRTITLLFDRGGFAVGNYDNSQSLIDGLRSDVGGLEVVNSAGQVIGAVSSINPVSSLIGNSIAVSITLNKSLNEGLSVGDALSIAGNLIAMMGAATVIGAATANPFTIFGLTVAGLSIGLTQLMMNEEQRRKLLSISPTTNTATTGALNWVAPRRDPLVLDLDGGGITTSGINPASPILFDQDGDGIKTATGWIAAGEAIVVRDLNGNGTIDSGRELFGDNTILTHGPRAGQTAANGFEALADLDLDADGASDGSFNSDDVAFTSVKLWKDLNQDGIGQSNELFTLGQLGVGHIDVSGTASNLDLGGGNLQTFSGTFTRNNGQRGDSATAQLAGSLLLANNNFYRQFTDDPAITTAAQALPQMQGSGAVRDLRPAMSLGTAPATALQTQLSQFAEGTTKEQQMGHLDEIIRSWGATSAMQTSVQTNTALANTGAGVGSITAIAQFAQSNPNLYAQITALEQFNGNTILDKWVRTSGDANLVTYSAPQEDFIHQAYDALRESVYGALVVQTRLKSYLDSIELTVDANGVRFDTTVLLAALNAKKVLDANNSILDLVDLNRYAATTLTSVGLDVRPKLMEWLGALPDNSILWDSVIAADIYHGANAIGSERADIYVGDVGANLFYGGGGDDAFDGGDGADSIQGGAGNDLIFGGNGDDVITGGAGNDVMHGGGGNDSLSGHGTFVGGTGDDALVATGPTGDFDFDDIYIFNVGDGKDTIDQVPNVGSFASNDKDVVQFGVGITPAEVSLVHVGNDLVFRVSATDQVTVKNWFLSSDNYMSEIQFSEGTVWNLAEMKSMAPIDLSGTSANDYIRGWDGADLLNGLEGSDTINAGAGADVVDGGDGNDTINGEAGDDQLSGGTGNDTLDGGSGNDVLDGGDGDDVITDGDGSNFSVNSTNILRGGRGNDLLRGHGTFEGGQGDDTLVAKYGSFGGSNIVYYCGDTYIFNLGDGNDTITEYGPVNLSDAQKYENRDVINFGAGITANDIRLQRSGSDIVIKVSPADSITIKNWFVTDASHIELINFFDGTYWDATQIAANTFGLVGTSAADTLIGTAAADGIIGLDGNDTLTGLEGNDRLDGGTGADILTGGLGDDVYFVDNAGDVVTESLGEGVDTVISSISYTLGANLENLTLTGADAINGSGNSLANVLIGNSVNNVLDGGAGNDSLNGGLGADTMTGGAGDDTYVVDNVFDAITELVGEGIDSANSSVSYSLAANLENLTLTGIDNINATGNGLGNVLNGNDGANRLDGGIGADTMMGGYGDDIYVVDNALDSITEDSSAGSDTVESSINWTLSSNVENLTLTGISDINATGNSASNILTGNAGNNVLNGGTGADTMVGGAGNDTYVVENAGDVVTENIGEGIDLVQSSVNYTLGANVDNLTLTGSSATAGTGNGLDNVLTGNSGANVLTGGAGNDTYIVGTGDTTIEAANGGTDTVQSAITWTLASEMENLTLTGAAAINGTGNASNNVITGNSAANTLSGAAGDDQYRYNVGGGADRVIETTGNDRIVFGAGITAAQLTATRTGGVVKLAVSAGDSISFDDLGGGVFAVEQFEFADGSVLGVSWLNSRFPSASPTATNVSAAETYTEDTPRNLVDIVVTDTDSSTTTVVLTLSNAAAGSLNTATAGTVASIYNANTGVWSASGVIANVNTLLAGLTFTPSANFNSNFSIGTSVSDGVAAPVTGIKSFTGVAVNDAATGTVSITGTTAQGQALTASNTLTDVDGLGAISYQWKAAGVAIAGASGSTLVLGAAQVGKNISVTASFTDGRGTLESATSAATASVLGGYVGTAGADTLSGSTGADWLSGMAGNDTYVVNNVGDSVMENLNEGTDLVQSSVTYTLAANVENLTLTGTTAINGTGNALDNVLIGNSAINTLTGGAGNDTLNGAAGADKLLGGLGNDTYVVDNTGDLITENAGEGTDSVQSSVTYTLAANLENITLTGTTAINATGNALDNVLTGNSGVNVLTGGAGNDTLNGGAGADSLIGGVGNDTYWLGRGYGIDTVTENDATVGNTDIARFDTGIATNQLWFAKTGNNLDVSIIGTSDKFTMANWYLGNQYHVEQFKTSDGRTLLDSQVQNLVNAMAAFAPPAAGQTTLSAAYANTLNPVIAANWH